MNNWSEGGYAFYITEYPDEGCVGPYKTRQEAEDAAKCILPDDDTSVLELTPEQCQALDRDLDEDLHDRPQQPSH